MKSMNKIIWYSKGKLEKDEFEFEIYDDFITNDRFRDFLISKGVYEDYIKFSNNNSSIKLDFKKTIAKNWINAAFRWSKTGDEYKWRLLNNEWMKICDREHIS